MNGSSIRVLVPIPDRVGIAAGMGLRESCRHLRVMSEAKAIDEFARVVRAIRVNYGRKLEEE